MCSSIYSFWIKNDKGVYLKDESMVGLPGAREEMSNEIDIMVIHDLP
jgi:hypothetical protein